MANFKRIKYTVEPRYFEVPREMEKSSKSLGDVPVLKFLQRLALDFLYICL